MNEEEVLALEARSREGDWIARTILHSLGVNVRFRHLSLAERGECCNGCGGKGHWLNPPDFIFSDSCDHHDFNYWLGGTGADRRKADWQFYQDMKVAALAASWWKRPRYLMAAWAYYQAVRWFAKDYFNYDGPRNWDDLQPPNGP